MDLNEENLYKELVKLKLPLNSKFTTQFSRHETIKAQLHFLSFKFNLYPIPEAKVCEETKERLDMLWVDYKKNPIVAIEIDNSIYPKSYKKLKNSKAKFQIIFSFSRRKDRFKKSLLRVNPKDILIVTPFI